MAIDFPNGPESGDVYTGPNGVSYTFDGIKWIGQEIPSGGGGGLPDQTGQAGKFLTTDGSGNARWADAEGPKGDTGDQGAKGDKGDQGEQGEVGPQGEQGVRGEQGEPGAEGQQGVQGVPGAPGSQGAPGQKGDQGIPGNDGAQGAPGSPGAPGADGAKGDPGDTGPRGEKGDQGVPGNDSTVQGPKGDTGDQGVSVTLQGTKATIADLPLTGSAGHGWIVTTGDGLTHLNGSLWFWNIAEGAWNDIGPIVGPQGDKGDPGDQGAKGDQGVPGNDGAPGADGAKGDTGETGPRGDPGEPGATGAKGDQGEPGEPGQTGEQGVPGQQGEQGVPGVPGEGVSTGGTIGQVLAKLSGDDYDTGWVDQLDNIDRLTASDKQLVLGTDGVLTFPNGLLKIAGNKIRNVNEIEGLIAGSELEVALAKTVITHGTTSYLGDPGGPSLTGQYLVEVGPDGILNAFQIINTLDDTTLTSELITELDNNGFKIGQRVTNDLGGDSEPLVGFSGWTFGTVDTEQVLTFPDSTVQSTAWNGTVSQLRSEGNIDIEVNLSDSTKRTWQFGEDGSLTLPSGNSVISNLNVVGNTITGSQIQVGNGVAADTGIIISNGTTIDLGDGSVGSSGALVNVNGTTAAIINQNFSSNQYGSVAAQQLVEVSGTIFIGAKNISVSGNETTTSFDGWTFDAGPGKLTFPDATMQTTAWTGLSATVGVSAPNNQEGALWYNSTDGRTYVKYGDLWVDANPPVVPHVSTYLDGLVVDGTSIATTETDANITVQDVTFTADGLIQLPVGGDIVDSTGASVLNAGAVVKRSVSFPLGAVGDTRGTIALTPAGETYICVADYQAPQDTIFTVVQSDIDFSSGSQQLIVDLRDYPELLAFIIAHESQSGGIGDELISLDGGTTWIDPNSYTGLSWYQDPPYLALGVDGIAVSPGTEFLIKFVPTPSVIWKRIVDVTYDNGDGSFTWSSPGDLTLETVRPAGYTGDCDVNIYAADDIFIEANGDDVNITASNEVSIESDGGNFEWRFNDDGKFTVPGLILSSGEEAFINFNGAGPGSPGGDLCLGTNGPTNVVISVDDSSAETLKSWVFRTNGGLQFPDGTIQNTAYSSIYSYTVSATPPEANKLWFNTVDGRLYINVYDEGTLWVDANPPVVAPVSTYLSGLTIDEQTISSVDHASPDVKIGGNLLPDQDLTYDLGSPTNQWNSLHIKDTTIYMSGRALSLTSEGLKVDGGAAISVLDGGVANTWLLPV